MYRAHHAFELTLCFLRCPFLLTAQTKRIEDSTSILLVHFMFLPHVTGNVDHNSGTGREGAFMLNYTISFRIALLIAFHSYRIYDLLISGIVTLHLPSLDFLHLLNKDKTCKLKIKILYSVKIVNQRLK